MEGEMEIEDNKMKDDEIEDELEVNVGGDDKKSLYLAELSDFKMKILDVLIKNNMNENRAMKMDIDSFLFLLNIFNNNNIHFK